MANIQSILGQADAALDQLQNKAERVGEHLQDLEQTAGRAHGLEETIQRRQQEIETEF